MESNRYLILFATHESTHTYTYISHTSSELKHDYVYVCEWS